MSTDGQDRVRQGFRERWRRRFADLPFRALIGPAQTRDAVQGCDAEAREQWKRDLENRRRYSREQRERKRLAHRAH